MFIIPGQLVQYGESDPNKEREVMLRPALVQESVASMSAHLSNEPWSSLLHGGLRRTFALGPSGFAQGVLTLAHIGVSKTRVPEFPWPRASSRQFENSE